ncbi:hypothetical protein [Endozoicomonas sp.]
MQTGLGERTVVILSVVMRGGAFAMNDRKTIFFLPGIKIVSAMKEK